MGFGESFDKWDKMGAGDTQKLDRCQLERPPAALGLQANAAQSGRTERRVVLMSAGGADSQPIRRLSEGSTFRQNC